MSASAPRHQDDIPTGAALAVTAPSPSRILSRRKRMIALTTALFVAIGLAYVMLTPTLYTARTDILISPRNLNVSQQQINPQRNQAGAAMLESYMVLMASDTVTGKVFKAHQLEQDREFASPNWLERASRWLNHSVSWHSPLNITSSSSSSSSSSKNDQPAQHTKHQITDGVISSAQQKFRDHLTIHRLGNSFVIRISVRSENPAKAVRLAGAIGDTFLNEVQSPSSSPLLPRPDRPPQTGTTQPPRGPIGMSNDAVSTNTSRRMALWRKAARLAKARTMAQHIRATNAHSQLFYNLQSDVRQAEAELLAFKHKHRRDLERSTPGPSSTGNHFRTALQAAQAITRAARARHEQLAEILNSFDDARSARFSRSSLARISSLTGINAASLQQLQQQYDNARHRESALSVSLLERHPLLLHARARRRLLAQQVNDTFQSLKEKLKQLTGKAKVALDRAGKHEKTVRRSFNIARKQRQRLAKSRQQTAARARQLARRLAALTKRANDKRQLLTAFLSRPAMSQLSLLETQTSQILPPRSLQQPGKTLALQVAPAPRHNRPIRPSPANMRIISPAQYLASSSIPNTPLILGLSLLGGLTAGIIGALLSRQNLPSPEPRPRLSSHHSTGTPRPPHRQRDHLPVLGIVPTLESLIGSDKREKSTANQHQGQPKTTESRASNLAAPGLCFTAILEALSDAKTRSEHLYVTAIHRLRDRLRNGIVKSSSNDPTGKPLIVLITSCQRHEGKSSLALALATQHARTDKSALLIDANHQAPDLSHVFARQLLDNIETGKTDIDELDMTDLADVIVTDADTGLQFLPYAALTALSDKTARQTCPLSPHRLAQALPQLAKQYELTILDGPDLEDRTTHHLAQIADIVVLCRSPSVSSRKEAENCWDQLMTAAGAKGGIVVTPS